MLHRNPVAAKVSVIYHTLHFLYCSHPGKQNAATYRAETHLWTKHCWNIFRGWYQYIHRLAWCCWHYNSYMKLKNAATHHKIPFIFQIASRIVDCVCTFLHVKILKAMKMKTMAGVPVSNCMHVYVLCCWFRSLHSTQNTRKTFNKTFKKDDEKNNCMISEENGFFTCLLNAGLSVAHLKV